MIFEMLEDVECKSQEEPTKLWHKINNNDEFLLYVCGKDEVSWLLAKLDTDGRMVLARDIPHELGFPVNAQGQLEISPEVA